MNISYLSLHKRILLTQLLSALFAVICQIHIRLLINADWMFSNSLIFYFVFIILIVLFMELTRLFLDGRWINIFIISFPYIIYWFGVLAVSTIVFPTNIESDDYGTGLLGFFVGALDWISVIIATIIGTYLKRKKLLK